MGRLGSNLALVAVILVSLGEGFAVGSKRNTIDQVEGSGSPIHISYEEAVDRAVQGNIDDSVLNAMRDEYQRATNLGETAFRLDVMINLGVALLQKGNYADSPFYIMLYKEAEQLLGAALQIQPGHALARRNLASVHKNQRLRNKTEPTPEPPLKHSLSYAEALSRAAMGEIGDEVVEAMRKELSEAEQSGSQVRRIDVLINLGVLLLQRGNVAANAADFSRLYRESEELLSAAKQMDPTHTLIKNNLAAVRSNAGLRGIATASVDQPPPSTIRPDRALGGGGEDPGDCVGSSPACAGAARRGVVASLSTIPPRMDSDLRIAIDSLLPQVDRVYLGVAAAYSRFPGPYALPTYLAEEPYASRVTVTVGPDHGAATKYLGSLSALPRRGWVLFCDDDQELRPDVVARMLRAVAVDSDESAAGSTPAPAAYQNQYWLFRNVSVYDLVHGYTGILFPASALAALGRFPLPAAGRLVDDQWMSAYCLLNGIAVRPTGLETDRDVFATPEPRPGVLGLASLANRSYQIRQVEEFFGVQVESFFYNHRLDVKINLAVTLMRSGNQAAAPAVYTALYKEAAMALRAALRAQPGHALAQSTLDAVNRNLQLRAGSQPGISGLGLEELLGSDFSDLDTDSDIQVKRAELEPMEGSGEAVSLAFRRVREYGAWLRTEILAVDALRTAHRAVAPSLSYIEALHLAMGGRTDEDVLEAMRWERLYVERAGRMCKLIRAAAELGATLLTLGDAAADLARTGRRRTALLYRESAEIFELVLLHQPHNTVVDRLLAESREKLRRLGAALSGQSPNFPHL